MPDLAESIGKIALVKAPAITIWKKQLLMENAVASTVRRPINPGEVFERLTVIGPADPRLNTKGYNIYRVSCRCSCGKELIVYESKLRAGVTRSCGCLQVEKSIANLPKATHGRMRRDGRPRSKTYSCWVGMIGRCRNPNHGAFKHYGGRGISVCERWKKFENFLEDMGESPIGLSLDRIDHNGNYEPDNCRWTDWETQENNRRDNRWVILNGENLTVSQASRKLGINVTSIGARAKRLGLTYQQVTDYYAENGVDNRGGGGRKRRAGSGD